MRTSTSSSPTTDAPTGPRPGRFVRGRARLVRFGDVADALDDAAALVRAATRRIGEVTSDEDDLVGRAFNELATMAVVHAAETDLLRSSAAEAARENALLRRAAAIDEWLDQIVIEDGGPREFATAVAQLTGKPAALHDTELQPLVVATPSSDGDATVPHLLGPQDAEDANVAGALAALNGRQCGILGPLGNAGGRERLLVSPVTVGRDRRGYVVVMEHPPPFGPLDRHIARRAATSIALVLAAERRVAAAEWDARAALVGDLIRNNREPAALERRARFLGVDLDAPHVLCLVTGCDADDVVPSAPQLCEVFARVAPDLAILAAGVPEGTLGMLELRAELDPCTALRDARTHVEAALAGLVQGRRTIATMSGCCTSSTAYARAYREAREALACLKGFAADSGTRVLAAGDVGPASLLLASSSRTDADRFVQDALGALLQDGPGVEDLLATLRAFFEHGRSVRCSAHALGVHENTVRYRLARIEGMTGLRLCADADHQLTAQLALLVLRLEGRLPDAHAGAPSAG